MVDLKTLRERWSTALFVLSVVLIILATLAPFDFSFQEGVSLQIIAKEFRHRNFMYDLVLNFILFIPLGFCVAALLQQRGAGRTAQGINAFLLGLILSTAIEVSQVFLPSRTPSSVDIYANSLGAFLGAQGFAYCRYAPVDFSILTVQAVLRRIASLSTWVLSITLLGYALLWFLLSVALQPYTTLSNWTQTYPMLIGSTLTGESAWSGYLFGLDVADRALSRQEVDQAFTDQELPSPVQRSLVASYQLNALQDRYMDRTGNSPALVWQGTPKEGDRSYPGASLSANQWLKTDGPTSVISQRLRGTSQFTVSMVLAATQPDSSAALAGQPAPIFSLSGTETDSRNLALIQEGNDLVIQLRTPVTGFQGNRPEFVVSDVFSDASMHHLIVTYDNPDLQVYVDNAQASYTFELHPGVVLFQKLLPLEHLSNTGLVLSKGMYYGALFIPLGIFVGFILRVTRRRRVAQVVLILGTGILIPVGLEILWAVKNSHALSLWTLGFSVIVTLGAIALTSALAPAAQGQATAEPHLSYERINL